MLEYTFTITDHIKVESKVTLRAVSFEDAVKIIEALADGEISKFGRLAKLSTSDLLNNIVKTQTHIAS